MKTNRTKMASAMLAKLKAMQAINLAQAKKVGGAQNGIYKGPRCLYSKTRQTFIYLDAISNIRGKHE